MNGWMGAAGGGRTPRVLRMALLLAGLLPLLPAVSHAEGAEGGGRPSWPPPPAAKRLVFVESFSGPEQLGLRERGLGPALKRLLFGRERREIGRPHGVAASAGGERICVADPGRRVVHVFDRRERRYVELKGRKGEDFLSPIGVALDEAGNLFVSDSQRGKILVFDGALKFLYSIGGDEGAQRPTGLAAARGRLYVVDTLGHRVLVYRSGTRPAQLLFQFGGRGTGTGRFNYPTDIAVSAGGRLTPGGEAGRIYVNDSLNFRIQVFDAEGRFLQAVGRPGGASGGFQRPKGIALDSDENLYVADALSDAVQIFDRGGRFLLGFGGPGRTDGEFWLPAGVAIAADRVLVADSANHRVQVFQYLKEPGQ